MSNYIDSTFDVYLLEDDLKRIHENTPDEGLEDLDLDLEILENLISTIRERIGDRLEELEDEVSEDDEDILSGLHESDESLSIGIPTSIADTDPTVRNDSPSDTVSTSDDSVSDFTDDWD